MLNKFITWIKKLFNKSIINTEDLNIATEQQLAYEDIAKINFTAIFSNSLANKTVSDANIVVEGDNKRSEFINDAITQVWDRSIKITQQALGKGGKVIVPYVSDGKALYDVIDQTRLFVNKMVGNKITSATILKDTYAVTGGYNYLWADYTLENGNHAIRHRATNQVGVIIPLDSVSAWGNLAEEIVMGNVDRLLFGFLKCPTDSRKDKDAYGVNITYGSESLVSEIHEHLKLIDREFKLTRPMLGLDADLWKDTTSKLNVQDQDSPFIPLSNPNLDGGVLWELYSPQIRDTSMYNRLNELSALLEKSVGTSRGILTERESIGATATEIKAAQYDTFTLVSSIRKNWKSVLEDLAYCYDVLAEYYSLTPSGARGSYQLTIDWDWSLFESSAETYQQLADLQSRGLIKGSRLNQYVTNQTTEQAEEEIAFVKDNEPTLSDLIGV